MNQKRRISFFSKLIPLFVAFSLVLGLQPAWATVEDDQTSLSDEEIAAAFEAGRVNTFDDQNATMDTADSVQSFSATDGPMKAFSGINRYDTAAQQAMHGWASSRVAILAGGEGWPDALAASGLAGALDCPVLLTDAAGLSPETANALSTLGVSFVIIVGGDPSVSPQVVTDLSGMSIETKRLSGSTRYDTQLAIYQYGIDGDVEQGIPAGLWDGSVVAVASGTSFADALSFSPVAFSAKIPVFLTNGDGVFSVDQENALIKGAEMLGLSKQAIALGGPDRITEETLGFLSGVSLIATKGGETFEPERLSGETRYETAVMIAQWAVERDYLEWDGAAFAAGEKPYDALGGGSLQGKQKSALLLVQDSGPNPGLDAAEQQYLASIKLFGDKSSISNAVRMDMADRFGFAYSDIAGLKVYIDAGHGWDSSNNGIMDYGAEGCGYTEWELTSDLSNRVGDQLRSTYGMETYVNDKGGWYKLRQAEAQSLGCDVLISIHFNAFNGSATGVESYIHNYNANPMSSTLQAKVHPALVDAVGLTNRGQKEAELAVCGGKLPAVLLEVCFIDNQDDIDTYIPNRDLIAGGIAAGIAS